MSTQLENFADLPDVTAVPPRLRGYMGEMKISRVKLAVATGINRSSLGKKLDGEVEFAMSELIAICRALELTWAWVTTGQGSPRPEGPNGGVTSDGASRPDRTDDRSLTRSYADVLQFPAARRDAAAA